MHYFTMKIWKKKQKFKNLLDINLKNFMETCSERPYLLLFNGTSSPLDNHLRLQQSLLERKYNISLQFMKRLGTQRMSDSKNVTS